MSPTPKLGWYIDLHSGLYMLVVEARTRARGHFRRDLLGAMVILRDDESLKDDGFYYGNDEDEGEDEGNMMDNFAEDADDEVEYNGEVDTDTGESGCLPFLGAA